MVVAGNLSGLYDLAASFGTYWDVCFAARPISFTARKEAQTSRAQQLLASSKDVAVATETTPLKNDSNMDAEGGLLGEDGMKGIVLPLKEQSIGQQLQSPQFLAQTIFFCWGMLHQNFYLGRIDVNDPGRKDGSGRPWIPWGRGQGSYQKCL
jgi:hypothetical protein